MANKNVDTDKELEQVLGSHKTRIKIVGAGGAGNNTVTRLLEVGIQGVEVVAVNTDAQDLLYANADQKVLIGRSITNGLGAGSDPQRGAESAKENIDEIEHILSDSDMVFITCGLGGGTGTGSAPIIAEVAKTRGALTIAIVTLPFSDEGVVRWDNARKGLELLQKSVDTVIVVQNDRLLELVPEMPLNAAFKVADEILVNAVKGITELVTEKGLVNLDFADVRTVMQNGGLAMIGLGECDAETSAEEAADKALQNPLLDVDVTGAKSALINITGGSRMSLKAAKTIMKTVSDRLDPAARIIWGARMDDSLEDSIRAMIIVTCLNSRQKSGVKVDAPSAKPIEISEGQDDALIEQMAQDDDKQPEVKSGNKNGSKVFAEIFLEESDPDITVLEEAIQHLSVHEVKENEKFLREIRSACSSLSNSSELFSFADVSEFVEAVGDVTESAIDADFELSEDLVDLFNQVPDVIRGLIDEEQEASEAANEIKHKFKDVLHVASEQPANNETNVIEVEQSNPESAAEKPETESVGEPDSDDGGKKSAVKYFDKLF